MNLHYVNFVESNHLAVKKDKTLTKLKVLAVFHFCFMYFLLLREQKNVNKFSSSWTEWLTYYLQLVRARLS